MSKQSLDQLMDAMSHHQNGRFAEARQIYLEVISADPDDANAEHLLAVAEYQLGNLDPALKHVDRALDLFPDTAQFIATRALVLAGLNRKTEAMKSFEQALQLDPGNVDARSNLANLMISEGHLDEAERHLTELLEREPDLYTAHNNLGLVFKLNGELDKAQEALERAVELNPDYFDGFNNLGNLYSTTGQSESAVGAFRRAVAIDPGEISAIRGQGLELLRMGRFEEALLVLQDARDRFPDDERTILGCGSALQELGSLEEAQTCYEQVLEIAPDNAHALNNLGTLYRTRVDLVKALELLDRALIADEELADAHFNKGSVLSDLGRNAAAESSYKRAIELEPDLHNARESLAILYDQTDNEGALKEVLTEWLLVDGENPIARHLAAAMGEGEVPIRCSPEYVEREFDRAAKYFDLRLGQLEYQLPERMGGSLSARLPVERKGTLAVLDAGCGTGLAGMQLRPWADRLIGVDLSGNMLRQASKRGCYDDLIQAELVEYLAGSEDRYDVCVGLDMLIYFGELDEILSGLSRVLQIGGLVVLSFENLEISADYYLMPNGRYRHNADYANRSLENAGFEVVERETMILRMELEMPVWGDLVWAVKQE